MLRWGVSWSRLGSVPWVTALVNKVNRVELSYTRGGTLQWNPSIADTLGIAGTLLISDMSSFQGYRFVHNSI